MNYQLDYHYGREAEQYRYVQMPLFLFTEKRFQSLSSDSKILYSLMLSRMLLSLKNGWYDKEKRVYIYFTIKEAMDKLNIAREKCIKVFAELDSEKGCGLITKVRQGLGKPDIIYVMKYSSCGIPEDGDDDTNCNYEDEIEQVSGKYMPDEENSRNSKTETPEVRKSNFKSFENQNSESSKIKTPEFRKSKTNKNDFNNNKNNNTDFSDNYPISSYQHRERPKKRDVKDEIREREEYRALICENIEYEYLAKSYGESDATGIVNIMVDAVCSKKDYLVIKSQEIPQAVVKSVLLKLDYSHVEYVLDCMKKNQTKVHNIDSYLLTSLYNSLSTIDHYYRAEVNHDMYGNI